MAGGGWPVRGAGDFFAALAAIERGEMRAYPTHCALLYTAEEGLDQAIARYVSESFGELDAMTGDDCLVFVVDDVQSDWRPQESNWRSPVHAAPLSRSDVYRIARALGIAPSSLPCAAFFVHPSGSEDLLTLRLGPYMPTDAHGTSTVAPMFRAIASATRTCAEDPDEARLTCLRGALEREHARMTQLGFGRDVEPSKRRGLFRTAGDTAASVNSIHLAGKTIAAAFAEALGIPLP
jgi:hypothetical protein